MKIGLQGFESGNVNEIEKFKNDFSTTQCIYIPQLIDKDLYIKYLSYLDSSQFYEKEHLGLGDNIFAKDQSIKIDNMLLRHINFLLNNSDLFKTLEYITGCQKIAKYSSRIYQNLPNSKHHLDWHDDLIESNRILGLSLNLSSEKYDGGVFQIREKSSKVILKEIPCGNMGDVHIFNISNTLEHQVTKTEGLFPRIAAAGWFKS